MAALSAAAILHLWEIGASLDPARRALAILAAASPEATTSGLAELTVGRRDRRLLEIRTETFGSRLDTFLCCPRCGERVEFTLETADLLAQEEASPGRSGAELHVDDWRLRYRMPTAGDLVEIAGCREPGEARARLVDHCVVEASRAGEPIALLDVPAEVIVRMTDELARHDPLAEVVLDFACPACGDVGQTLFDIGRYFWEELRAQAVRLLHEVSTLARCYGWREADILALSPIRRHAYLELAAP